MALAVVLTLAARQAKAQANPSSLALTAATATSSLTAGASHFAANARKRDEAAQGVARGGNANASQIAAQGRKDRHRQDGERTGKAVGEINFCKYTLCATWRRRDSPPWSGVRARPESW